MIIIIINIKRQFIGRNNVVRVTTEAHQNDLRAVSKSYRKALAYGAVRNHHVSVYLRANAAGSNWYCLVSEAACMNNLPKVALDKRNSNAVTTLPLIWRRKTCFCAIFVVLKASFCVFLFAWPFNACFHRLNQIFALNDYIKWSCVM